MDNHEARGQRHHHQQAGITFRGFLLFFLMFFIILLIRCNNLFLVPATPGKKRSPGLGSRQMVQRLCID